MKQRETDLEYVRVKVVKGDSVEDLLMGNYTGVSRDHAYTDPLEISVPAGCARMLTFGVITTKDYYASNVILELKRRNILKGYLPDEFPNINMKIIPLTYDRPEDILGHHVILSDMERMEINEKRIALFTLYVKNKTKEVLSYTDIGLNVYGKAGLESKQRKLNEIFDVKVNLTGISKK